MEDIVWSCHICGEVRPDCKIYVHTTKLKVGGVEFDQNVRYCNDNPSCVNKAPSFSFLKSSTRVEEA